MPLYEYRCEKCGKVFEVRQKFSDNPLETHEECGGKVERLLSAPALQFKGSGFYITDYARGGSSSSSPAKSDGKASGESKSESKSESKPAETKTSESKSDSKPSKD